VTSPDTGSARRLSRLDFGIASGLALGYFVLLAATSSGIGYVRDEGHYFRAAEVYNRWFEALWDDLATVRTTTGRTLRGAHISGDRESGVVIRQPEGRVVIPAAEIAELRVEPHPDRHRVYERGFIDSIWRENSEHPVLMKTLFVLSWRIFYEKLGWTNQGDAFRIPAWLFAALGVFLLYLWGTELYDRRLGLFASATFLTMPHVFYHAHLACFDVPMVTMWLAVLYAFWKAQRSTYWGITVGPVFALALATKHNAFFLPFIVLAYYLLSRWRDFGLPRAEGVRRLQLPPIPIAFVSMLLLSPILYYAHWPFIWNDPVAKLGAYLGYHMSHEHYDVPYLGRILHLPPFPWHFPYVMSVFTVPEMTVLLGGFGFCWVAIRQIPRGIGVWLGRQVRRVLDRHRVQAPDGVQASQPAAQTEKTPSFPVRARRLFDHDQVEILLLLGGFVPFAIIGTSQTPKFGGTKHWMPAMPFVALYAAVAFHHVLNTLAARWPALSRRPLLFWAVMATLCLAPSVVALHRSHPFGTSYHNLFAGGLNGAARLGNAWQFWGGALRNVARWLNEHAEHGAGICHHKTNSKGWVFYQRDGILRRDFVGLTGLGRECQWDRADYHVYQHQPEYQGDEVQTWHQFGTIFPVHVVALDGMPLVSVYKKAVRLFPERGAQKGSVLYGRAEVGSWRQENEALHLSAWRKDGQGRGSCEGVIRANALERAGRPAAPVLDPDDGFRTLFEGCFGTRLPR
jgi:4-amino-4-deoxy-L-arabinose transferase-like glycosyltransferase